MRTCSYASERARAAALAMAVTTALTMGSLACAREVEIPTQPDVAPLVQAYESPDGVVDSVTVAATAATAVTFTTAIAGSGLLVFLGDLVQSVQEASNEQTERVQEDDELDPHRVKFDAVVRVRRVCSGWNEPGSAPDPDRDGIVDALGVVRDNVLEPTITGTATRCRQSQRVGSSELRFSYDGGLTVFPFAVPGQPLLVQLDGVFESRGVTIRGAFDFRVLASGRVELRLPAPTGGSLVFSAGEGTIGVRGSNGTFTCALDARICTGPAGEPFQW